MIHTNNKNRQHIYDVVQHIIFKSVPPSLAAPSHWPWTCLAQYSKQWVACMCICAFVCVCVCFSLSYVCIYTYVSNIYVYTHTYIHAYIHTYMHTRTHTHTHTHTHTYIHTYIHKYIQTNIHAYINTNIHVRSNFGPRFTLIGAQTLKKVRAAMAAASSSPAAGTGLTALVLGASGTSDPLSIVKTAKKAMAPSDPNWFTSGMWQKVCVGGNIEHIYIPVDC